ASALAREDHAVDRLSGFFDLIHPDPIVNRVKLIAEPWDVGDGGYQVGNFPPLWSEWNGKYRDKVRDYWRGTPGSLGKFASRFSGSADLYHGSGRETTASINFITAHDGFTLVDLVAYNNKHNEANAEQNRDGESHNRSWNSGIEGETTDPVVLNIRKTRQRSLLATLLLSQGVPMLLGGDELGRTQRGNNNAYCQDNHLSWLDWSSVDAELHEFTRELIRFRADHPVFRRRQWFDGRRPADSSRPDIEWFNHDGQSMNHEDWQTSNGRLMAFLNGNGLVYTGPRGEQITDRSFLVLFNPQPDGSVFTVPTPLDGSMWQVAIDTDAAKTRDLLLAEGETIDVAGWSMVVLEEQPDELDDLESAKPESRRR
ncbi:MAG: glycogen debranching enzyme, partial [Acidimicrobiales bacterium]